ncbi:Uncharacterised protein [Streptococcus pneumoniae]|nr:Uncharacterised protein [Streptococcus pneumoniae]
MSTVAGMVRYWDKLIPEWSKARKSSRLTCEPAKTVANCSKTWQKAFQTSACLSCSTASKVVVKSCNCLVTAPSFRKTLHFCRRFSAFCFRLAKRVSRGAKILRRRTFKRSRLNFPWWDLVKVC